MIVGVGTDLVEISRLEKAITRHGDRFVQRIFSPEEQKTCTTKANQPSCFAKRFAAKEAFVKALGTGMREGIWFRDIVVSNDSLGKPLLHISGESRKRMQTFGPMAIHLSLSDDGNFALAFVVLETHGDTIK